MDGRMQRRKSKRVAIRLEIQYRAPEEKTFRVGVTDNVSEKGLKFQSPRPFPEETTLEFKMRLPGTLESLAFKGRVARVKSTGVSDRYDVGVTITEIKDTDRNKLKAKISSFNIPFA